jgi:hypothetical protein
MEALKIYEGVLRELDRFGSPRYDINDHNYFVNKAKNKVVDDLISAYEVNQVVTEMLANVIVVDTIIVNPTDKTSLRKRQLRPDFDSLKSCLVTFRVIKDFECFKAGKKSQIPARRLTEDAEMFSMQNQYYRPSFIKENVFYQTRNKEIELFYDTIDHPESFVIIDSVRIEHTVDVPDILISPTKTNLANSALHRKVNQKIIEVTALMFLENSKSQRTQSFSSINQ